MSRERPDNVGSLMMNAVMIGAVMNQLGKTLASLPWHEDDIEEAVNQIELAWRAEVGDVKRRILEYRKAHGDDAWEGIPQIPGFQGWATEYITAQFVAARMEDGQ